MISKLLKFLKWTFIILLSTPVCIYLVWLTGNLHNNKLNPELASLMARRPAQMNAKDNAYFDTLGLGAPTGMEPNAWGAAWFAQVTANDRAIIENRTPSPVVLDGYPPKFNTGSLPCSGKVPNRTCIEEVGADPAGTQRSLNAEAIVLKRFDAVLDKTYQEPYREFSYLSEFAPRAAEHHAVNLALIRIALEFARGHEEAALSHWKKETAFLLRQSAAAQNLVDKMVLNSALSRYQRILSDYLFSHPRTIRGKGPQILALLEPFNRTSLTLQPALESEAIASARYLTATQTDNGFLLNQDTTALQRIGSTLLSPFLDRQSTANELADRQLAWSRAATLEGVAYRTAIDKLSTDQSDPISGLLSYHNPVGKFLARIGTPDFSQFMYRSDDIIASKNLMSFAVDLVSRQTTATEQIRQAIDADHARLEHPFTGKLPVWNAEKRTLSYPAPNPTENSKHPPLVIKL